MMADTRDAGQMSSGGRPKETGGNYTPVFTLEKAGIDKDLAKRARKYAAIPEQKFEAILAELVIGGETKRQICRLKNLPLHRPVDKPANLQTFVR